MAKVRDVALILVITLALAFVCAWANPPWTFQGERDAQAHYQAR